MVRQWLEDNDVETARHRVIKEREEALVARVEAAVELVAETPDLHGRRHGGPTVV